jgi:hypothetical protein
VQKRRARFALDDLGKLRSIEETARILGGVSVWTVRQWIRRGLLEGTKVGARMMVSDRAITRFLARCNPKNITV